MGDKSQQSRHPLILSFLINRQARGTVRARIVRSPVLLLDPLNKFRDHMLRIRTLHSSYQGLQPLPQLLSACSIDGDFGASQRSDFTKQASLDNLSQPSLLTISPRMIKERSYDASSKSDRQAQDLGSS
ncbi:hypothetical protein DL546_006854 [Coniochaeta pulveracea]|uniref:Uncharacterized protein n=1 Tax=Coniochaeta pulveracea TaxID=177199 RepID=A0A420Y6N2_9PEZI|nr:hypothetical protein DL546_006854 [Coniochaeta pulveracea]